MALTITETDGITVVCMGPRLDTATAPAAASALQPLFDGQAHRVVFDCEETEYIASAGLRVLLVAVREITKTGGKAAFCSLSPQVKNVFEIGGFARVFLVAATRDAASALLRG